MKTGIDLITNYWSKEMRSRLSAILILVCSMSWTVNLPAAERFGQAQLSPEAILSNAKRAHILTDTSSDLFNSYRMTGCMRIKQLPSKQKASNDCIREETGVQLPAFGYVGIDFGSIQSIQLIDMDKGLGSEITLTARKGLPASRKVANLLNMKYDITVENTVHSLIAFLQILNNSDRYMPSNLSISRDRQFITVRWQTDHNTNEFVFAEDEMLCVKQVRTSQLGVTIFKYSNYKRVSNVMLPFTIEMVDADGKTVAVREVDKWALGIEWPQKHFDADTLTLSN